MKLICMKLRYLLATVTAVLAFSPYALSQENLVKVDIKNIANDVAQRLDIEASKLPLLVQAPAEVAAKACRVSADDLRERSGEGGVGCVATSSTPELERIVQKQVAENK